ncbi:bifunctional riboflavin kinase/FAD synthetase [Tuwongella immobilis]|uniref:Riboflavin biosynthesis protein n=1 Tax=Tuwongella immobilis TaxID=692036 RepID=A0A6C2YSY7_9BACT|nr:bifunctional riboflavin kinase/FAD synthetase [Tuwongella immobilis]VIP04830.1 riboflavin biosynthesis protein : Riboflavin biosynthesis protein OS=Gemmata sp. Wa1-1 PE=3 SV=1: FAD_syn: Flavokinase [Tuwongella immobilis]VTS07020.1 riboflavin biosynthesis protein : Riboflavin biosynthesis protein OS=Gemmata sp. Wa1-1 PE=3 SV=1: FAD_syn: Flavokinase [Tuwongella immobilis]
MAGISLSWHDRPPDSFRQGAVSIGNFDGVHLGHRALIAQLQQLTQLRGGPVVMVTFHPHPLALLAPDSLPIPLMTLRQRTETLRQAGADAVWVLPTERDLLALDAPAFFHAILRDRLHAHSVVEGFNFRFGNRRAGDMNTLRQLCEQSEMDCREVAPILDDGEAISSSRIRQALLRGEIEPANRWLGQPYRLSGKVVSGAQRGRNLGFPTANLAEVETLIPAVGVYAVRAWVDNRPYAAAANIGPNPTFGESERKLEVHLLDFQGNLYDRTLEIEFIAYLRATRPFAGIEALLEQLRLDIAQARHLVPLESRS